MITVRLFSLQVLQHAFYEALASGQHDLYQKLFPERGEIYAQDPYSENDLYKVVVNRDFNLVYANPTKIENAEEVAKEVAPILGLQPDELISRLTKADDVYEPLKNKASDLEVEAIKEMQISGIDWRAESWRYYPEGESFAQVTGFLGYGEEGKVGQYGLEGYWEEELAGKQGELKSERDAGGRFIAVGEEMITEAEDGKDLILTIDKNIQFFACQKLGEAVQQHGAKKGTVIIVQPQTGAILTMCNYPTFNPNDYSATENLEYYINSAISDQYEPGSVFKSLTMAAAVDQGKVTPDTTYNDTGSVEISGYTIENSDGKAYGTQNMTAVLANSLNTGSIFAAQQIGNEAFYNYVSNFGFGVATGIELAGEASGDISEVAKLRDIYTATASYGQGLTMTPLQLIMAYSSLANGGKLMKPYLVQKVIYPSGYEEVRQPEVVREVLQAQTARILSAMLVQVVDNGHAKRAAVEGYFIGGKTGTAQIPRTDGQGYDKYRHKDTFVGFGPISNPQFVILTKLDEPQDVSWAEGSAVPLFGEIAKFVINYYHIPPDRE